MNISNERPQGSGELTIKSSKGVCYSCGDALNTALYVHISDQDHDAFSLLRNAIADASLSALNTVTCSCGEVLRAEHPLTVHLSSSERLLIFIPSSQALIAHELFSQQLSALAGRAHVKAQRYFTQPELYVGVDALRDALDGVSVTQGARPSALTPAESLKAPSNTPVSERDALDPLDELLDEALDQETTGVYDMSGSRPAPVQMSQHLTALDVMNPATLPPVLPESSTEESAELSPTAVNLLKTELNQDVNLLKKEEVTKVDVELSSALSDDLSEGEPPLDSPTDTNNLSELQSLAGEDNTSIQALPSDPLETHSAPTDVKDLPSPSTELLYSNSMRHFDHEAAGQGNTYLKITEGLIEAAALLDERQAEGWLLCDLDVRAQLHFVQGGGAAPCLTLFSVQDGEVEDELYWPIEVDGVLGPKVLRALRKDFKFELTLYKKNGHHYGQRLIEAPLEDNVGYILSAIKRLQMTPKQSARALFEVRAEEFDRDGRMKHSFSKDSYSEIESASDAKLATGIWGYWSTVKQRDYLLLVKSFPLSWLRRVQHRILKAGLDYGIAMPAHLQSQAVALRLAKSDVELLQRLVANFAEVSLKLKSSQLSPEDEWENWDQLLAQVDELGIPVDEEIEQLAFQAMERAGLNGDSLFGDLPEHEVAEPLELIDELEVDELEVDEVAFSEPELVSDDLIEEELIEGDLLDIEFIDEDMIEDEELIEAEELIEEELELLEDSLDGEV